MLAVRSSVEKRLGVNPEKGLDVPRQVDGLLDIMEDAVLKAADRLAHEWLKDWQAALFPSAFSGMAKILVDALLDWFNARSEPASVVISEV